MKRRQPVWLANLIGGILLSGSLNVLAQLPDDYEDDNTVSNATAIDTNGTLQKHTIHSRTDEDWFQFTANSGYSYQIKAEQVGSDLDIALELYRSDNTLLKTENFGFEGEYEQIDYVAPTPGSFYVKVKHTGFFGDKTGYSISVKKSVPSLAPDEKNPQTLKAGETATLRFQLRFEEPLNNPLIAGRNILFSLDSPDNQANLSVEKDVTDNQGQVSTQITAPETAGTYTLTATLAENDAITAKAEVEVIASVPDKVEELTVSQPAELLVDNGNAIFTEIDEQITITFKLTDKNGNVIKETPEVNLVNHQQAADKSSQTLDSNSIEIESNGQISITWFPDEIGRYTLKTSGDAVEIATVYVLRTGVAFNTPTTQYPSTITTAFGGISNDNGQSYRELLSLTTREEVSLQGLIKVDDQHACKAKYLSQQVFCKRADIIVVSMLYLPFDNDLFLFGRDNEGQFQFWSRYTELTQNIDSLAASKEDVFLSQMHRVDIYQGTFPFPGILFMYFGYRLKDGTIVYNGQQYMTVIITDANTTPPE